MIQATFDEAHSPAWIKAHIIDSMNELVLVRQVIPWPRIIAQLVSSYAPHRGRFGTSLRMMVALLIVAKLRRLSDREVIQQVKENRYIQYFCNVPDAGLLTFLDPSVLSKFRTRLGEKGIAKIETEVFERLRQAGVIQGDTSLIDSTVLDNNLIYPNDVQLLYKAFGKYGRLGATAGSASVVGGGSSQKAVAGLWLGLENRTAHLPGRVLSALCPGAGNLCRDRTRAGGR